MPTITQTVTHNIDVRKFVNSCSEYELQELLFLIPIRQKELDEKRKRTKKGEKFLKKAFKELYLEF